MDRTIIFQLHPTTEQVAILQRTLAEHTACFNAVAQLGFETAERNGVSLHKHTYYDLRAQYPDLPSQLVIAARMKATEAVASALTWKGKHAQQYQKNVVKWKKQGREIKPFRSEEHTSE